MIPQNSRARHNSQRLAAVPCGIWEEFCFHIKTNRQNLAACHLLSVSQPRNLSQRIFCENSFQLTVASPSNPIFQPNKKHWGFLPFSQSPICLKLLRSFEIKHLYFMHFMLILQAWMMSNPSLSYVDHVGMLPNNNCSLKCVITCVHTNTFSHSIKGINSPQSIVSICREKKNK